MIDGMALGVSALMNPTKPKNVFDVSSICFPEQLKFIRDKSPWVTAMCSRRAGKTEVCAIDLINTALTYPNTNSLYLTLTRLNAEQLIWPKLLKLIEKHKILCDINISRLAIRFPNGSIIFCSGCKDKSEVEKFRGNAFKLIYIDEAQSFKSFLEQLIDDVLAPALADHAGSLKFLGTPPPLDNGFFMKLRKSEAYAHYNWTFWQNPFIPALKEGITHEQIFDRELKRRGVSPAHPSIRREWFGEFSIDTDALVIHYDAAKNSFDSLPLLTDYVISADVGHDDADAIAVIGWHKHEKRAYLVEEFVRAKQGVTEFAEELTRLYNKYNPLRTVMDTGGLGKKIAEEIRKRYSLPIEAAEKTRKNEYIEILNDALRTDSFRARHTSQFAQDSFVVEWDFDKSTSDRFVVKDEPHSDIIDAVLYGFRECLQWLSEAPKPKVNLKDEWVPYTKKLMDDQIDRDALRQQDEAADERFWQLQNPEDPHEVISHFINKRRGL